MPYVTLTHHLLAYNRHESETVLFNADDMAESLIGSVNAARRRSTNVDGLEDSAGFQELIIDDTPIVIESYVSLVSVIHNQSKLGFYMERGGVSF